ncbi:winged helix-turn-helix domain-containing protein [Streptomyces sp. NPDC101110]|uniref:winged helix-turn-helix domain-containing protein n=1 Tax=Streptomyces sp. NPDC101110 TaxID=3366104 RepID=UPI00380C73C5
MGRPTPREPRERIRLQAVIHFEGGETNRAVATALRVIEPSVERWCRAWRERGEAEVLSRGSPGRSRLSETQIARLKRELERGPLVHGWADQRWTLTRIKTLLGRLFHVSDTVEGTWRLLKRHGWRWQQPVKRAIEQDDNAVGVWKKEVWPRVRASHRSAMPGSPSRTRPGSRRLRRVPGPGVGSVRPRSCGCGAGAPGGCRWRALPASSRVGGPGSSMQSASIGAARTSRRASAGQDFRDLGNLGHRRPR